MRIFALLFLVPALPPTADAASDAGQMSGFIRDTQQGALPGATVTLVNEATSNKRSTVTNPTGFYVFPEIPVGAYSVSVELAGFKKFVKTGVRLSAASQIAV